MFAKLLKARLSSWYNLVESRQENFSLLCVAINFLKEINIHEICVILDVVILIQIPSIQ